MSSRSVRTLAWSVGLLAVALGVGAVALAVANDNSLGELLVEDPPLSSVLAISFPIVGILLASRRPDNAIGWIFCVIGLSQGLVDFAYYYANYTLVTDPGSLPAGGLMSWLGSWAWVPGFGLLVTFLPLLFPTGRLPSRRWRPVAWASVIAMALLYVPSPYSWRYRGLPLLEDAVDFERSIGWPMALFEIALQLLLACALASIVSLVVRFRGSHSDERQQLKWFTYTTVTAIVFVITVYGPLDRVAPAWESFSNVALLLLGPCMPVAIGIAILKYRLYDIDRVINRTLVYGALTAILAAAYFGLVVVLQQVLPLGEDQGLAVAGSTLAVAALFRPLRARTQGFIDRRFYRSKYDAAQMLERFSTRLRDEVDLDALTRELLGVVQQTMHPAHASLWLRRPAGIGDGEHRSTAGRAASVGSSHL